MKTNLNLGNNNHDDSQINNLLPSFLIKELTKEEAKQESFLLYEDKEEDALEIKIDPYIDNSTSSGIFCNNRSNIILDLSANDFEPQINKNYSVNERDLMKISPNNNNNLNFRMKEKIQQYLMNIQIDMN